MVLASGTRLGIYEVIAPLGVGGMGEVYRARDTKLNRDVALKVLPDSFTHDPDRVARFRREAQVLASLNHPHIGGIYGFEDANGVTALVLELVEGPTLADRIALGAMPFDDAMPIATQIVEALEAAHDQGIIHRDLKPANIKVRSDGTVKVLDFGLAKALEPSGANPSGMSHAATITTPAMTQVGVIMGTAAYMSPEQARGKVVDKRADIWAFGCVLHEMLTGRRVFEGDEVSDTLAFVLTKDPDWSALPADTPAAVRRLLRRCLAKDKSKRLPDIGSARLDIEDARSEPSPSTGAAGAIEPGRATAKRTVAWAIGSLVLAALTALVVWTAMRGRQPGGRAVSRVLIGVSPAEGLLSGVKIDPSIGRGRPSRTAIAVSPDGRSIVFSAEREGRVQLYVRRLDQLDASAIAGTEGASNPFLSPDGQSVGFHAGGALKKVPLGGGPVVPLCDVDLVYGAAWGRTGQIVFARETGGLWQVPASGGMPTAVTTLQANLGEMSHRLPQFLPDGQTVLYTATRSIFPSWDDTQIVAQSLTTGARKVLIEGGADARFVATGHLLYLRRGTLMAVPFDPQRLEVMPAAAVGLVADVMQAAGIQPLQIDTGAGQVAVSESGSLLYVTGGVFPQDRWQLAWVDRAGRSEALRIAPGAYLAPRLSPDGKRVAFGSATDDWDLWTYDVMRGVATRLPMEGEQSIPLWTPDGSRLAFSSVVKGRRGLFLMTADGSGTPVRLAAPVDGGFPNAWTPDGGALLAFFLDGQARLVSRDEIAKSRPLPVSDVGQADFSPDGRWLASATRPDPKQGRSHVHVQSYPAFDHREQISIGNGSAPAWRHDGRELYYAEDASADGPLKIRIMAVPVTTSPTFAAGTPKVLFEGAFRIDGPFRGYDVTPDGQRFLMVQEVAQPRTRVSQMVLVENWFEDLKRLVPAK